MGFLSEFFARITGSKTRQDTVKTSPQQELKMAKVLVLYHSMYGHIETMAQSVAEGARSVPGDEGTIKRVPETMPE